MVSKIAFCFFVLFYSSGVVKGQNFRTPFHLLRQEDDIEALVKDSITTSVIKKIRLSDKAFPFINIGGENRIQMELFSNEN